MTLHLDPKLLVYPTGIPVKQPMYDDGMNWVVAHSSLDFISMQKISPLLDFWNLEEVTKLHEMSAVSMLRLDFWTPQIITGMQKTDHWFAWCSLCKTLELDPVTAIAFHLALQGFQNDLWVITPLHRELYSYVQNHAKTVNEWLYKQKRTYRNLDRSLDQLIRGNWLDDLYLPNLFRFHGLGSAFSGRPKQLINRTRMKQLKYWVESLTAIGYDMYKAYLEKWKAKTGNDDVSEPLPQNSKGCRRIGAMGVVQPKLNPLDDVSQVKTYQELPTSLNLLQTYMKVPVDVFAKRVMSWSKASLKEFDNLLGEVETLKSYVSVDVKSWVDKIVCYPVPGHGILGTWIREIVYLF